MHIRGIKPKKTFPKAYVIQVGFRIINQSKTDLTLMNICNKYISLMECERCKTKKTKDLETKWLKMTTLGAVEVVIKRFHFMIQKGAYLYENMDGWEKFE